MSAEPYRTVLTVVISPCLLGFDVKTYNAREYANGFTQGQGFIRPLGIYPSFGAVVNHLIWTAEPFRVILK